MKRALLLLGIAAHLIGAVTAQTKKQTSNQPPALSPKTGASSKSKATAAKVPPKSAASAKNTAKRSGSKPGRATAAKKAPTSKSPAAKKNNAPSSRQAPASATSSAKEVPSAEEIIDPTKPPQDNAGDEPAATKKGSNIGPNVSLRPDAIADFDAQPPGVQRLLASALDLTTRQLTYRYGSSDPATGGMDCSGTIYFLLRDAGIKDPPRDSSGLYLWTEEQGTLRKVQPESLDDRALDDLRPGDLLFWEGTYETQRQPPISHTMIYLGREKKTGTRVMVGASDGRTYRGVRRYGVSVFDFKLPRAESTSKFVGYAKIPGLEQASAPSAK